MNSWGIPCNLRYFNVIDWFKINDTVVWKKGNRAMEVGDEVYIYIGIPNKEIKYKCEIINGDVDAATVAQNKYATIGDIEHCYKYMQLKLKHTYEPGIDLMTIKEQGTYLIRKQGRLDRKLANYIHNLNEELNI